jgi:CheY-like chemotaxis protein
MATVLLVEDNEANRDMLSRRLIRRGWIVLLATDGRQGLEMATTLQPDLILMDMSLPEISGWEVTKMLKEQDRTRKIPLVGLTAHAMPNDMERAFTAGCDDFETKPVDFDQLLAKMSALVQQRSTHVQRG